jgi:hypothetical protein
MVLKLFLVRTLFFTWGRHQVTCILVNFLFECLVPDSVSEPDPRIAALIWLSWIRIGIGNADPDTFFFLMSKEIDQNEKINLVSSLLKWLL